MTSDQGAPSQGSGDRILRLLDTLEPILATLRAQAQILTERSRADDDK